ncbi:MAG TPA: SH3 domain-containing protein [Anaerolineales bacterium]|jgi:hypothetical protein|nr:SH3 domain-containing protein [Anaerolineales bacterium]
MDADHGLTCSSVNLRSQPDLKSRVVEALDPQEHVQILQEAGDMLEVQATKWKPPIMGYLLKSAVIRNEPTQEIFPKVDLGSFAIPSVPPSLPFQIFSAWLDSGMESPWLPASYLDAIRSGQQPSVGNLIRQSVSLRRSEWDAWVTEIKTQGREATATIDEWMVILSGGRGMWSFRTERIFAQPSQSSAAPAWVMPKDVLRWTGHVRINDKETKYKTWYEVEFTKLDRQFKGWYKASLLEEFVTPTPDTDLTIPENKDKVFDLKRSQLRLPMDPEIDEARKASRRAFQFIDIKGALGWAQINHNLCGQFCVASLGGSDVIPLLKQWLSSSPRAKGVLEKDFGTSIADLEVMLDALKRKYEFFRAEASVAPLTPGYLRKMLDAGRMAIVGTGLAPDGAIKWNSRIRHWIVIENLIRVGNSGWVRIYNPYFNREEVYSFETVFDTLSRSAIGLWVEPAHL